jgi:hypothetical protein
VIDISVVPVERIEPDLRFTKQLIKRARESAGKHRAHFPLEYLANQVETFCH